MELKNEVNKIYSSRNRSPVEFRTKSLNPETGFYFNPRVLFSCKLCRAAFPTVDTLLKHKRRKHTVRELQGIKCVIFEERFVHNEHLNDALIPYNKELPERIKTEDLQQVKIETSCDDKRQKLTKNEEQVDHHMFNKECKGTIRTILSATASENPDLTSGLNSDPLLTTSNSFVVLLHMNEKEIEDAKINLKNAVSRKRKSGVNFITDLGNQSKRSEMLKSKKPNKKETPIRCSPAEKSHLETENNEFIILDIITKADGQREIVFSTTTELRPDQGRQVVKLQPTPNEMLKFEEENLLQPKAEEINEEMPISVFDDLDSESQFEEQQEREEEVEIAVSMGTENDKELAENQGGHFDNVEKEIGLTQLGHVRMNPTSALSVFKQWLKKYKKDFPENLFFLEPDPLQETESDQGQSNVKCQCQEKAQVAVGVETIFPLRCKVCNRKLEDEATTKDHVVSCWRKMSDKYCLKCNKCFLCKSELSLHNKSKHFLELGEGRP